MRPVEDFLNYEKGDIITLSSLGVMEDHDAIGIDLVIQQVRKYHEPNDAFMYTGYICETEDEESITYMLMVMQVDDEYELRLYYLDKDGDISEGRDVIVTEDGQDLIEKFEIEIYDSEENPHPVNWDKQHSFFGVEYNDEDDDGIKTIGLYYTNDDCGNNPYGFIEWAGSEKEGWFEFWMGTEVKDHEVEILSTQEQD